MSEYVSKKAVLEWLKEQQKQQEEKRDRLEKDHPYWEYHEGASDYLRLSVEKIQSGAFDAEQIELQRLRAALVKARAVMEDALSVGEATYEDFEIKLNPWADISMGVEEINKTLYQTPTEPSVEEREGDLIGYWINEKCPKCGADMLGNKVGDKWCSLVGCDYSINAPEKVGTEEWRHKYFGAEWPKAEGDGNDA